MRDSHPSRSSREARILSALKAEPGVSHHTEFFARAAQCSIGEAVVELQRLEREYPAHVGRARSYAGMTWRWVR